MAVFRPSALIGSISGSVAGVTFVATSRANVVRIRPLKKRITSEFALIQTSKNALIRLRWGQLTDVQRLSWRSIASQLVTTDRFGLPSTLSGFQLFIRYAMILTALEVTTLTEPPTIRTTAMYLPVTLAFTEGGPYNLTLNVPTGGPVQFAYVYGYRTMQTFEPKFLNNRKFILRFSQTPVMQDIQSEWEARFGAVFSGEIIAVDVARFLPGNLISETIRTVSTVS